MNKKNLIKYAEKNNIKFTGEKNSLGYYVAKHENGMTSKSFTLDGLKRMIDLVIKE